MYVKDHMTKEPVTITEDVKISKAVDIMSKGHFHRLPIVDGDGRLIGLITGGLVTEKSGANATSLSIYELNYLLSKTTVKDIMLTDIKTITATRPQKLKFARLLMDASSPSARLFGLELGRFTAGDTIYDVENDFHGVYYLWGWAGLLSLLLFLGLFARRIPAALRRLTPELAALLLSLGFALLHALFTAGVLRRPNSSFYLSAVLAALWESTSRTYTEK